MPDHSRTVVAWLESPEGEAWSRERHRPNGTCQMHLVTVKEYGGLAGIIWTVFPGAQEWLAENRGWQYAA